MYGGVLPESRTSILPFDSPKQLRSTTVKVGVKGSGSVIITGSWIVQSFSSEIVTV